MLDETHKGKGHTNKECDEKGKKSPTTSSNKGKGKGKAHANAAEQELSSDEELEKSFTVFVNIVEHGDCALIVSATLWRIVVMYSCYCVAP